MVIRFVRCWFDSRGVDSIHEMINLFPKRWFDSWIGYSIFVIRWFHRVHRSLFCKVRIRKFRAFGFPSNFHHKNLVNYSIRWSQRSVWVRVIQGEIVRLSIVVELGASECARRVIIRKFRLTATSGVELAHRLQPRMPPSGAALSISPNRTVHVAVGNKTK